MNGHIMYKLSEKIMIWNVNFFRGCAHNKNSLYTLQQEYIDENK